MDRQHIRTFASGMLGTMLLVQIAVPSSRADQASDKALFAKVDPLFASWDNGSSPGFVLGIVRDGKLIYQRSYGMANLEEGVPLAKHSVFQAWSFTKTFTTLSLALLLDQGKVALDDPLSKFVPEIPEYDPPIKIRHLVQCTSGLHDYYLTMQLAGWSWRDAWTERDVLDLLARRKSLALKPGDRFQYSNSDFFLLGLIFERASGKSLPRFAEEHLFAPLGMKSTFFDDNPAAVVRNRAVGYERRLLDGKYYRSMIQSNTVGAIDLKTTVEDLVRWDQNFYDNRLKEGPHVKAFLKQGHLDNRQVLMAYPQEAYRGLPRNWYTGGGPGFYAHMLRFPKQRFSIILLSNLAEEREWHAMTRNIQQIADLFLADQLKAEADVTSKWDTHPKTVKIAASDLRDKAGLFREPGGVFQKLIVKDNRLWWISPFQHSYPLSPLGPERFRSMLSPVRFDLELIKAKPDESYAAKITHEDGTTALWQPVKPVTPTPLQLDEYAGSFFCRDLQAMYKFTVHDGALAVQINHGAKRPLAPMSQDVFTPANRLHADWIFTFVRGDKGGVTGFTIDWARVRGLAFQKVP
jgi:CubicO group peptidase (beta-lactamase class C family)